MNYYFLVGALLPSVVALFKDAVLVRFTSAGELAKYLLAIFVIQSAVGVIANSLHFLAAVRFKNTSVASYPIDKLSNFKTFSALLIALCVIVLTQELYSNAETALLLFCGMGVLYFISCLITSFFNVLLSASNERRYVVIPICTHLIIIFVAIFFDLDAMKLLVCSVVGALLEASILFYLLRRSHTALRIEFSQSYPPPRTAIVAAILNSASPFIIQLAAYKLGPISFLSLVYGQKIANMLATIGATIIGATYFHLNLNIIRIRFLAVLIFSLTLVAVTFAQAMYPFPLQAWLGADLIQQLGNDLNLVYSFGWGLLACQIIASVCYRKCMADSPSSLMVIKAIAFIISLIAFLAVRWGVIALVSVQLIAAIIEVSLLLRATTRFSNARVACSKNK